MSRAGMCSTLGRCQLVWAVLHDGVRASPRQVISESFRNASGVFGSVESMHRKLDHILGHFGIFNVDLNDHYKKARRSVCPEEGAAKLSKKRTLIWTHPWNETYLS